MLEQQLTQLGFGKNDIKVYLALFDIGKSRAGEIIDYTDLHRNLVYTSLDELVERGLVTKTIVKGVAEFLANNPEALVSEIDEKKELARDVASVLEKKHKQGEREVVLYEGVAGVKRAVQQFFDLEPGQTGYIIGSSGSDNIHDTLNPHWEKFHKKRVEKNIPMKLLYDRTMRSDVLTQRNSLPITEAKYMPQQFEMPMWMYVLDDTVSLISAKEDPLVINIKSKEIASAFGQYFDFLWDQEVRVETGKESAERAFDELLGAQQRGDEYYVIGSTLGLHSDLMREFFDGFHHRRIKKGVRVQMLASAIAYPETKARFAEQGDPEYQISEIKKFITDAPQPFQINLYNGKTQLVSYGEQITVMHFDRYEVYEGFKSYFDAMWEQKTTTFRGNEGFHQAFDDITQTLKPGEELLLMGMFDFDPEFADMVKTFHAGRDNMGIKARMLLNQRGKKTMGDPLSKLPGTQVRYMEEGIATPAVFLIYGEKTLITIPGSRTFLRIENADATNSFRTYFESLWEQETQVLVGPEALQQIWFDAIDAGELRWVGASGYFIDAYPELFQEVLDKAKCTEGIVWRNIVDTDVRGHVITTFPWAQTRYSLPEAKNPNVVWLYGETVVVSNWAAEELVIFVSKNKQLYQSYSDYFDALWDQKNRTLVGREGIVSLCDAVLEEGKDLYLIGATGTIHEVIPEYYPIFNAKRIEKNIKIHMLADEGIRGTETTKLFLSDVMYLPKEFESPMTVWVFGDYVASVMWNDPQTAFLIHDKDAAVYYRRYYEGLKKSAVE